MASDGHPSWLHRMTELTMAAALGYLAPPVTFQHTDHVSDLHQDGEGRWRVYCATE
jgi:hypothetical protein